MGLLSDVVRSRVKEYAVDEFNNIEAYLQEKVIGPIESNTASYETTVDFLNETQERINFAWEQYEKIQSARQNARRARIVAENARTTADTSDKAATIASALDKISAAISYGLKLLKERLRSEIDDLKDLEEIFQPTKKEFVRRRIRLMNKMNQLKDDFQKIEEERKKRQAKINAKRAEIGAQRQQRLRDDQLLDLNETEDTPQALATDEEVEGAFSFDLDMGDINMEDLLRSPDTSAMVT